MTSLEGSVPSLICAPGEMLFHSGGDASLVARGLGSSVAVAIYCPRLVCGGLLHYLFPHSSLDAERAQRQPAVFANTGLPQLLRAFVRSGGDPARAKVWLAGGASNSESSDFFGMGERNLTAAKAWLWKEGLAWESVGCGGVISRDLSLELRTGSIGIRRGQNFGGENAV